MTQSSTTPPLTGPASAQAIGLPAIAQPALAAATSPHRRAGVGRRFLDSLGLYAILAPTFLLLAVFCLVPFLIAIATSFFNYEVGGEAKFVGLSNYLEYLH